MISWRARLLSPVVLAVLVSVACSDKEEPPPASPTSNTRESPAATASATASAPATASTSPTAASATPSPTTTGSPTRAAGAAAGRGQYEGTRALANLEALTKIGPRVAGSEGERVAAQYIKGEFERSGYRVELQDFTFETDPWRASTVTVNGKALEAFAMAGSPGGKVTAEAVDVGLADPDGLKGKALTGKIAVAQRGTLSFKEKLEAVEAAGAIALIVVNDREGELLGNLFSKAKTPTVGVSKGAGAAVIAAARSGARIELSLPDASGGRGTNVVAKPAAGARCEVIVGGHYDTVPGTPGAHDNASGTAETIELARAFAADGLDAGLCFVAFSGEESGLNGSRALVAELDKRDELPRAMVNLDTTGAGEDIHLIGSAEMTKLAESIAAGLSLDAQIVELGAQFGSDHQSFAEEGVPVVFFASDTFARIHTPQDTFDTINADLLERQGDLAYAVIVELLKRRGG